ncbi:hypothetical protein TcWFU_008907 [Taenia crassiceps]|uniref:Uncharacterized protein n=1 Tax=Taenia crassiceps TaxID=6207 RepID=A0ABR4Q054_9CEST
MLVTVRPLTDVGRSRSDASAAHICNSKQHLQTRTKETEGKGEWEEEEEEEEEEEANRVPMCSVLTNEFYALQQQAIASLI